MTTPDDPSGTNPYEAPAPGSTPPPPPPYGAPQSQYGGPQYGGPQYGAPQYGGEPAGVNGLAIASLVCAFFCSPLGIIFGLVARSQIQRTGQRGAGLALAGVILSVIFLVVGILTVSSGRA
jgi:peptidyl-prolyl cis-trans isomerase B (cyclophilin B)